MKRIGEPVRGGEQVRELGCFRWLDIWRHTRCIVFADPGSEIPLKQSRLKKLSAGVFGMVVQKLTIEMCVNFLLVNMGCL